MDFDDLPALSIMGSTSLNMFVVDMSIIRQKSFLFLFAKSEIHITQAPGEMLFAYLKG